MNYIIKARFHDEIRKFKINSSSYNDLYLILSQLFNVENFILQYKDEDDDLLTISSDIELKCALECEVILKLIVKQKNQIKTNEEEIEIIKTEEEIFDVEKFIQSQLNSNANDLQEIEEVSIQKQSKNQQKKFEFENISTEFPSYFQNDLLNEIKIPQHSKLEQKKPTKEEIKERKKKFKNSTKSLIIKVKKIQKIFLNN